MDFIGQQAFAALDVQVFPSDGETRFDVYDDDGETYAYEQGASFLQPLSVQRQGRVVNFHAGDASGNFKPAWRHYVLAIHGDAAGIVRSAGKPLPRLDSIEALRAADGEGWAQGKDRFGEVTYVKLMAGVARDVQLETRAVQP